MTVRTLGVCALALAPFLAGIGLGAPTLTYDLAAGSSVVTRIYGHSQQDGGVYGVPVCGGHDCDGDGFPEIAFAQFLGSPMGRTWAGEVSVVFGDGTIGWSANSAVPDAGILLVAGERVQENTGDEAWIDDVTGDGLGDLLIGRQNYTLDVSSPGTDRRGAGALSILVGDPAWKTHAATLAAGPGLGYIDLGAPPGDLKLITFVGPAEFDRLGIWMRTGDITGDGIVDILVGADEVDADGSGVTQNQGAAFVIRGGPHLLDAPGIVDLADFGEPDFPEALKGHVAWIDPPPGSTDDHFGGTVQIADLDGNRRAEVLVAATINRAGAGAFYGLRHPQAPNGTGEAQGGYPDGRIVIVWDENFPPGLWPENHRFEASNPPYGDATVIDGPGPAVSFGEEMVGGLDYSGDGFPDLMIGDLVPGSGRGYVFYNAGNLRGLSFDLGSGSLPAGVVFSNIYGPTGGSLSSDTVLHGDFDGDGIADLGIGNPHDNPLGRFHGGSVHVLYGQAGGWPATINLSPAALPSPATMRIALVQGAEGGSGNNVGDTLCYSAASGDINNDGRTDLIVNEMAGNGFGGIPNDVGNMIVIDAASLLDPFAPSLGFSPPGPVDFGSVPVGGGSAVQAITITNNSAGPVTITSLVLAGPRAADFAITADSGETTLAVSESRVVTVTFDPSLVTRSGAALRLSTNVDPHPVAIGLRGHGVDDVLVVPELEMELIGADAVMHLPSQFGTNYTLLRVTDLASPAPLYTVPGTGETLFLTDPEATDLRAAAFYRVLVGRE